MLLDSVGRAGIVLARFERRMYTESTKTTVSGEEEKSEVTKIMKAGGKSHQLPIIVNETRCWFKRARLCGLHCNYTACPDLAL